MAENKTDGEWLAETQDSLPLTKIKAGIIGEIALSELDIETEKVRMEKENETDSQR